jgi:phytoene dehydrogenase-like protein
MQRRTADRGPWDAIVVGSGLGGLTCAAYLAAAGKRTLVLEAHYVAGGNSQAFRRRYHGRLYEFDVGLHYIGECGPEGLITRILRGVGLERRLSFRALDPDGFSTLIFPDLTFRVPTGWDRYRARLLETFADEAEAVGRVVDTMRVVGEEGRRLQNGELALADAVAQAPTFCKWGLRPVTELFAEHHVSERAAAVLLGEQGDYAVRPSRTPVALAAGLTDHYMRGAFYPEGGGQMLAARLVEAIRAYGGEVRTRARVRRIRIERGRVAGVVLEHGEEIDAPIVVSNADLKRTVRQLVGPEHFAPDVVAQVDAYRMSLPLFVVYLGVAEDYAARGVPNTNFFLWDSYDIERIYEQLEAGRMPDDGAFVYVTVTSLKDPSDDHVAPPGHSNVQIMTVVPREYGLWNVERGPADGGQYHQDGEYRHRKLELTHRLVRAAERVLPGLSARIDWMESASPVTQERFTLSTGGTSYGIEFAVDQMGPLRIGPQTQVGGLYLAGASTPSGHGIASVMRSGVQAAAAVLGRDLLLAAARGEVLGDRDALPPLTAGFDAWRASH